MMKPSRASAARSSALTRWARRLRRHRPSGAAILRRAAEVMDQHRFTTIAQMMHEAKKVAYEADVEVSEAVDFARYAAATAEQVQGVRAKPLGVVVVTPSAAVTSGF